MLFSQVAFQLASLKSAVSNPEFRDQIQLKLLLSLELEGLLGEDMQVIYA